MLKVIQGGIQSVVEAGRADLDISEPVWHLREPWIMLLWSLGIFW